MSSTPRYKRKMKLKMRFGDRLDAELTRTVERVMLLAELVCDKRHAEHRARVAAMPKPPPKAKPTLPRVPRMNDWGLEKHA